MRLTREELIKKARDITDELNFNSTEGVNMFNGVVALASELLYEPEADVAAEILEEGKHGRFL